MTPHIRPFRRQDTDAIYQVCLLTGDDGRDASSQVDRDLMGDVWAGPYLALEARCASVAVDDEGVAGYVIGTRDTRAFEVACATDWWPRLRERYAEPAGPPDGWNLDERLRYLVHHPLASPDDVVAGHPAHLHLNLLPRAQGQGAGHLLLSAALDTLRAAGVPGVHVGVSPGNERANRFWERGGFVEIRSDRFVRWLGRPV